MPRQRVSLAFVLVVLFVLPLLSCGDTGHSADELYILVSANIQVPYWKAAGAGLSQSAGQIKVRYDFVGPDEYNPQAEKDVHAFELWGAFLLSFLRGHVFREFSRHAVHFHHSFCICPDSNDDGKLGAACLCRRDRPG